MAIRVTESPDSGGINYDANGGGTTLRYTVVTTAAETEAQIYTAALYGSFPYLNGFIRRRINVTPKGGPNVWTVEIEYGTTGVGGGDQPLGGQASDGSPPPNAEAPASTTTPLTSGWSFSIRAPKLHLTQSRATVLAVKRGGGVAEDFKGRVGVDRDRKTVGVDWPPEPAFTFKRTVAAPVVTLGYLETLALIAGRPNNAPFYGFDAGSVILLEADGQFTQGEGWSITFGFGVELGDNAIEICDGLPTAPDVIAKKGFEYLWILEEEVRDPATGKNVVVPSAAYVEELLRPVDFGLLLIGT